MSRNTRVVFAILLYLGTCGSRPFEDTDREVRFYRTNIRLLTNLIEQHSNLPLGSCLLSQLPSSLDPLIPESTQLYLRTRRRLAKGLHKLNQRHSLPELLSKLPTPCDNNQVALKRLERLLTLQRAQFETVLATTILVLEKYFFKEKAQNFRKLYQEYFPGRDMEKEFSRRYNAP